MGGEAVIELGGFEQQKDARYFNHFCRKRGHIILELGQMGFYLVAHGQIVTDKSSVGQWEIDPPAGCPWCHGMPEVLRAVYLEYLAEEERKKQARINRKKGKK